MNNLNSQNYGVPAKTVEKKSLIDEKLRQVYDFHRMVRVSKDAKRYKRNDIRFDKKNSQKTRQSIDGRRKSVSSSQTTKKKRRTG